MKNTKKKGFTIVELVIVIAVIGILSAVLIPTFSSLVKKAKVSAFQQGLQNAYTEYATLVKEDELLGKDKVYFKVTSAVEGVSEVGFYTFDKEANAFKKAADHAEYPVAPAEPAASTTYYRLVDNVAEKACNGYTAYYVYTTAA